MTEKSLSSYLKRCKTRHQCGFQRINASSRLLLKKAVRSKDKDALDALILDIEHSIHLAAGNLTEILKDSAIARGSFGKYYTRAMETLSLAEIEYRKLVQHNN